MYRFIFIFASFFLAIQSEGANLSLQGIVPTFVGIEITPYPTAVALPLISEQNKIFVGELRAYSNSPLKMMYLTVVSSNYGELKNTASEDTIPYQLFLDNKLVSWNGQTYQLSTEQLGRSLELSISYKINRQLKPGIYKDFIQFMANGGDILVLLKIAGEAE